MIDAASFSRIRRLSGALDVHVLLSGRDPQIGNGFHGLTMEYGCLVFYLTDTKHGMRHVPCYWTVRS